MITVIECELHTLFWPSTSNFITTPFVDAFPTEFRKRLERARARERSSFHYSNVSPLVTRIHRFIEDPMFTDVVDVNGGPGWQARTSWRTESSRLVERIFGGQEVDWRVHIINLRRMSHDLTPFVLGSL